MEIIAELNRATDNQRLDFIVEYNHNQGYKVTEEIDDTIPSEDEDYDESVIYYNLKAYAYTDEEQAEQRETKFKADFFLIPNYGWFRKKPKGYSSAVESLNTAFNAVSIMSKLPEKMLIFYTAPDFSKPEECTEEWLIEHQTFNAEMSAQEFGVFYVGFMTAWNTQEHVNEENNNV